jgi:hypothetical protein
MGAFGIERMIFDYAHFNENKFDKQHMSVVDREPYYVCRTFLYRATTGLLD